MNDDLLKAIWDSPSELFAAAQRRTWMLSVYRIPNCPFGGYRSSTEKWTDGHGGMYEPCVTWSEDAGRKKYYFAKLPDDRVLADD